MVADQLSVFGKKQPCVVGTNRQSHDTSTDKKKLIAKRSSDAVSPKVNDKSLSHANEGTAIGQNDNLAFMVVPLLQMSCEMCLWLPHGA